MIEIVKGEDNPVSKFFSSSTSTPETDAAQHEGLLKTNPIPMQVVTVNFARNLERERNEARDMVEKLTEQGLDLMDENRMLKRQIKEIKNTIRETLEENRHLADGDDCTLRKLKQLVRDNSHDKVSRDGVLD